MRAPSHPAESQPSALRLLLSFCCVNLLIVGLFVALVPHQLRARLARPRARRGLPRTARPRTAQPRTALGR